MKAVVRWITPWAALGRSGADYAAPADADGAWRWIGGGALWLCVPNGTTISIDGGKPDYRLVMRLADQRSVFAIALPSRPSAGLVLSAGGTTWRLALPAIPDRPHEADEPTSENERAASALLARVKAVWARVRDIELCLANPATIWPRLTARWLDPTTLDPPMMDVIVRHARTLARTLALLHRAPRRVLRRRNSELPLGRVQEMDRRSMVWLVRQPGATLAERAGDRQRIMAVAREENFDTLENRVLHSYARLAAGVARDYAARQRAPATSGRAQLVRGFGKACRHAATDLRGAGVREAPADAIPNFVLQNNTNYQRVWTSWQELLQRNRILDRLWRWQARSWEEFCALAVVVALQSCDDAFVLATSPIAIRDEQDQGRLLRHANPLAVFHLVARDITVEVTFDPEFSGPLRYFAAPIWLRYGRVDDPMAFLRRCAVWPVWHAQGGLDDEEPDRVDRVLDAPDQPERPRGGIVVRPAAEGAPVQAAHSRAGRVACLTLGPEGVARADGIALLRGAILRALDRGLA